MKPRPEDVVVAPRDADGISRRGGGFGGIGGGVDPTRPPRKLRRPRKSRRSRRHGHGRVEFALVRERELEEREARVARDGMVRAHRGGDSLKRGRVIRIGRSREFNRRHRLRRGDDVPRRRHGRDARERDRRAKHAEKRGSNRVWIHRGDPAGRSDLNPR